MDIASGNRPAHIERSMFHPEDSPQPVMTPAAGTGAVSSFMKVSREVPAMPVSTRTPMPKLRKTIPESLDPRKLAESMPTLETGPQFTVIGDSILNVGRTTTERSMVKDNVIRATNQRGQTVELPQVSSPAHLHLDSRAEHPALSAVTSTFDKDLR